MEVITSLHSRCEANEWQPTHPLETMKWTWDKNRRCNGHYVNVVKALKWWRTEDDPDKNPINVELPKKVNLKVIEAPPSIKGDSATTPTKTVVLETKAKITVPIFVKKDDLIRVNTDTGGYVERV